MGRMKEVLITMEDGGLTEKEAIDLLQRKADQARAQVQDEREIQEAEAAKWQKIKFEIDLAITDLEAYLLNHAPNACVISSRDRLKVVREMIWQWRGSQ